MDLKALGVIFATVFVAELGDKTQLATVLFAADREVSPWLVFFGASTALVLSAALGVLLGSALAKAVDPRHLSIAAGIGFIAIGAWTLWTA
jgi:putative Ca2+/H+ antiporter (TMEM165/GDT1 family)